MWLVSRYNTRTVREKNENTKSRSSTSQSGKQYHPHIPLLAEKTENKSNRDILRILTMC